MQIIRHHSYTLRGARLYGIGALALLGAIVGLSFVSRAFASIPLLLLCFFGLQVLKDVVVPRAESWITGHMGEKRVLSGLGELPESFTAITNFVVPGTERGDIDLILVGPMGVAAVEIKTYEGVIVYENGRWWRRQRNGWKTRIKKHISGQAKGHQKSLIKFLKERRAERPMLRARFVPVTPILVFVSTDQLETGGLDMAAIHARDLKEHVLGLPASLCEVEVAELAALFRENDRAANCRAT